MVQCFTLLCVVVAVCLSCLLFCFRVLFFRLNNIQVRNEFLKQIPHMAEATLPTNYMDWKWKQMNSPLLSTKGRRDHGIATEEPHYLLVRNDDASPHHLGITLESHIFVSYIFFIVFLKMSNFSRRI